MEIRFVRLGETDTYAHAHMPAVPREGETVHFGDGEVFKVAGVMWEPLHSHGFSAEGNPRVNVIIYPKGLS